ncbi:hypothetical protein HXP44_07190 [Streptomyces sioyaensis]|uniref:Secreted protein n=1 Tax=Streptomyces sioyaensis TaxID=67364 RepID=A0A4Q1QZW6_9ACTN|nr:hypothetical protein [Streptomyces sioyaensis]MBM4791842.1 hypothetical protein [Streptomyces sioyaensis]RXS68195.1 hypothetical protein EST54_09415 [Streptomyces sioyaensis]
MPPSRARATTTALALLLLATTGTACTAAEHASTPASHAAPPPPATRQVKPLQLPLDAYASTVAETHLVEDAQDVLMRRCMKGLGMEWKALPRVTARDIEPPNLGRYGADEADALQYGYHPRPDPPSVVRRNRAWDEREALPAEVQRAAYGASGKGGCLKEARHQLVGDTAPPDYHAFNQLTGTALKASRRTPEVRDVLRRWHTCMAKAGFDYPEPMAAAVSERWKTPDPTPAERATARADVACQQSATVVKVWSAAESRIQRRLIEQNADRLDGAKARKDRWLAAARRVLGHEGGAHHPRHLSDH